MGLTHYWQRGTELPADAFLAAAQDSKKVLADMGIAIAGSNGTGPAEFRPDAIVFNGLRPACVEPFQIRQREIDRHGRSVFVSFCKTGGAPYDLAVKVTLILLKHHLKDRIVVTSDAKADEGWDNARIACEKAVGYGGDFRPDKDDDVAVL